MIHWLDRLIMSILINCSRPAEKLNFVFEKKIIFFLSNFELIIQQSWNREPDLAIFTLFETIFVVRFNYCPKIGLSLGTCSFIVTKFSSSFFSWVLRTEKYAGDQIRTIWQQLETQFMQFGIVSDTAIQSIVNQSRSQLKQSFHIAK